MFLIATACYMDGWSQWAPALGSLVKWIWPVSVVSTGVVRPCTFKIVYPYLETRYMVSSMGYLVSRVRVHGFRGTGYR